MNDKFEKEYKINIYDVDSNLKCKFSSLVNYLWDVVISQSDFLGETNQGFVQNNSVWVLLKYDINIYEYPKLGETITVDTYVIGIKKFYGYRGNTIKNSKGKIIGEVLSVAMLIDIEKRLPKKASPDQFKVYGIQNELETVAPLDDILKLEKVDYSKEYNIRYSDIDSNNHVNNVKYMEFSIDTLPRSILNEYTLYNIKVLFKKETTDGSTVRVSSEVRNSENSEITTLHTIVDSNEKLLTKLELKWKRNS